MTKDKTLNWLLNTDNPSLRYRVMTELLDIPINNSEVAELKKIIPNSPQVVQILSKMHPDGYWLQQNQTTKRFVGHPPGVYGKQGKEMKIMSGSHFMFF